MPKISKPTNTICESCRHDKQTKFEFKTKEHFASRPLELVHTDLCGPMRTKGLEGESVKDEEEAPKKTNQIRKQHSTKRK